MALQEIVELTPPAQLGSLHFIAIGGAGMSGIASCFHQLGNEVTGCDKASSPAFEQLLYEGIDARLGHDPSHLNGVDTVVVSSAIRADNPELALAKATGLRVLHRSAALGSLLLGNTAISVAGTHGKTTTTAMITVALQACGVDPSYVVGAQLANTGFSARLGAQPIFVVEADESDGSFLQYPTKIGVITNIEPDHLDNWGNAQAYAEGFYRFATGATLHDLVINIDDPTARELAQRISAEGKVKVHSYGQAADADYRLSDLAFAEHHASAKLGHGDQVWQLSLGVPGAFNLANATAAFIVGRLLGQDGAQLAAGLADFRGTARRFEFVGEFRQPGWNVPALVFDDYAHHPSEITAVLDAARNQVGDGRLVACFQPHLFTRTRDFAERFGKALALADQVVLTDIYPAREDPIPGVDGQLLVKTTQAAGADVLLLYVADKTELPAALAKLLAPGDLLITIGAGDITQVGPKLLELAQPAGGEPSLA